MIFEVHPAVQSAVVRVVERKHAAASPSCPRGPIPGHMKAEDAIDATCFACGWHDVVTGLEVAAESCR